MHFWCIFESQQLPLLHYAHNNLPANTNINCVLARFLLCRFSLSLSLSIPSLHIETMAKSQNRNLPTENKVGAKNNHNWKFNNMPSFFHVASNLLTYWHAYIITFHNKYGCYCDCNALQFWLVILLLLLYPKEKEKQTRERERWFRICIAQ